MSAPEDRTSHHEHLRALRQEIEDVLVPHLGAGRRFALVGLPLHRNVGDHAIWLGERALLERLGLDVVYTCDRGSYSREQLAANLDGGTILITGGGNLGDLWPAFQRFRERLIADFPQAPIVQLPQSIHFDDAEALARARAVLDAHLDLTLLVRDRRSLDFAREHFRAPSALCPDMALALDPESLPRPQAAGASDSAPILWLARDDKESRHPPPQLSADDVLVSDWPQELPPPGGEPAIDLLARERVLNGCRMLAAARVVITDRLHGHILAFMLGQPHVLLDNSVGKLSDFSRAWTEGSPLVRWARSPQHALELAREIAGAGPQRGA